MYEIDIFKTKIKIDLDIKEYMKIESLVIRSKYIITEYYLCYEEFGKIYQNYSVFLFDIVIKDIHFHKSDLNKVISLN